MTDKLKLINDKDPWYKDGLRFKCTECGMCCTGAPGAVWITDDEIQQMAAYLKITKEAFIHQYTRKISGKYSLKEMENYDCIFLKDNKCSLYRARPKQCRTYPFWPDVIKDKKSWNEEKKRCEGINDEAPVVSFDEIQGKLNTLSS